MTSSIISTSSDIHQSVENINSNKVIWDKYERELNQYHEKHMKYTDPVYPPIRSSLYIGNSLMKDFCQLFEAEGKAIEWMRIPDVFPQQSLTIWNSNPALKNKITKGYISKTGEDSDYLPTCFNAIKAHNSLLERMFGSQNVNEEGLYIVKMHQTQTNIWKYVTVDDYIPVIVNRNLPQAERRLRLNITPAFLTVEHKGDSL